MPKLTTRSTRSKKKSTAGRASRTRPRRPARSKQTKRPRRLRLKTWALLVAVASSGIAFAWLCAPFWQLRSGLSGNFDEPSRLLEQPPRIDEGAALNLDELATALRLRGYREVQRGEGGQDPAAAAVITALSRGEYVRSGDRLAVSLRSFPRAAGQTAPVKLEVRARGGWVRTLTLDDQPAQVAHLDPLTVATYYDDEFVERRRVRLAEMPRHVMLCVLAAEDAGFFNHPGLSVTGIARALWVNLKGQRIDQGGSTLTQQLVKNRVLTHDRTVVRKLREAVVSVLVELRFTKAEILEAYLNEVFLGRSAGINVVGLGAAAQTYFGLPAAELSLAQSASLAGMIRAPAALSPHFDLAANQVQRDRLLHRLADLEWIDQKELAGALAEAPPVSAPLDRRRARYAADAAASELESRYGIPRRELSRRGLNIVSTLVMSEQEAAERVVEEELARLDAGIQGKDQRQLQAALVTVEPRTGGISAWVGGRDYGVSQFDRVRLARRQVGSAFKPVVLAAALSDRTVTVADRLLDEPLEVRLAGNTWRPQNDNRQWSGEVSVREVFERSLNVPTVRLAMDVGLDRVVDWAQQLGVESKLRPMPSLALGAFEMTPLELARVYSTFAAGGIRPPLHLVAGVLVGPDVRMPEVGLAEPRPVLNDGVAYLVTSVLEGVLQHGTGASVRQTGFDDLVAGKSGTSNQGRDSWFAGYARQRATVVWVGYDSGGGTRLSGARGALPIWGKFMQQTRPAGGFTVALPPGSIRSATIDLETGFLATSRCPQVATEVFLAGQVPGETCWIHGGRSQRRGFWKRMFGRGRRDSP